MSSPFSAIVPSILSDTPLHADYTGEYLDALFPLKDQVRAALAMELPHVFDSRHSFLEVRCLHPQPVLAWTKKTGEQVFCSMASALYDMDYKDQLIDAIVHKNVSEHCHIYYLPQGLNTGSERYAKYKKHNRFPYWHHAGKLDIGTIHSLTFDIDPVPALLPGDPVHRYPSASDEEYHCVHDVIQELVALWVAAGFPTPHSVLTGNGGQIVIKVHPHRVYARRDTRMLRPDDQEDTDEPTPSISAGQDYDAKTVEILTLFSQVFTLFKHQFRDRAVKFDQLSLGLHQGLRMPGTVNWKGKNTPERPQRLVTTVHFPDREPYISHTDVPVLGLCLPAEWDHLKTFVAQHADILTEVHAQEVTATPPKVSQWNGATFSRRTGEASYDYNTRLVEEFCAKNTIGYRLEEAREGTIRRLDTCLYRQASHHANHATSTFDHAWVSVAPTGKISAGCFNNDCQEYIAQHGGLGWQIMRGLGDPEYKERVEKYEKKDAQERLLARIEATVEQGEVIRSVEGEVIDEQEEFLRGKPYWDQLSTMLATKNVDAAFEEPFLEIVEQLPGKEMALIRKKLYEELSTPDLPFDIHRFNRALGRIRLARKNTQTTLEDYETSSLTPYNIPEGMSVDPQLSETFIANALGSNMYLEQTIMTACLSTDISLHNSMDVVKSYMAAGKTSEKDVKDLIACFQMMIKPPKEYDMSLVEVVGRFPFTLTGNAMRVADFYREQLRYCPDEEQWYEYIDGCWRVDIGKTSTLRAFESRLIDPTVELEFFKAMLVERAFPPGFNHIVREAFRRRIIDHAYSNQNGDAVSATEHRARTKPEFIMHPKNLNVNKGLLNMRNGTHDLARGVLHPHNPRDLITKQSPIAYDPDALCPHWLAMLDYITHENQEYIDYIQRVFGYCLTGDISEKCFFILYGEGDTLKSTFMLVLASILGDYAEPMEQKTLMQRDNDALSNDVLALKGLRVSYTSEASASQVLGASLIKMLTSGTDAPIRARGLYKESEYFIPTTKLFLDTNQIPHFESGDSALMRRMKVLPFTHKITVFNPDYFATYLAPELPGILAWAIRGCQQWTQNRQENGDGLRHIPLVEAATQAIQDEKDTLLPFIEECLIITDTPADFTSSSALYDAYTFWCNRRLSQRKFTMSSQRFWKEFAAKKGFTPGTVDNIKGYKFLKIKNEWKESVKNMTSPTKESLEALRRNSRQN